MSNELAYLARLNSLATKELKITAVDVFGSSDLFTSQLTEGYTRKGLGAYNNSGSASGEICWGPLGVTAETGMPIPKGSIFDIPCSVAIPIYFCNTISGETGNLRVVEIA